MGYNTPPFAWNEDRRFLLRCELDAQYFHLYGLSREETGYILETFPIVRRRDEQRFGEYRTKRVILDMFDAMAEAKRNGVSYQTRVDPPPADPRCQEPRMKVGILAFGSLIGEPGLEIAPRIVMRIRALTPFPVEYGRVSRTRGGAPTLVPHPKGSPVCAEILVLAEEVPVDDARDMLWRRERRKEGSGERYSEDTSAGSVLVREFRDSPWVSSVLYTDFHADGKIESPTAEQLARLAIGSTSSAGEGKDGITYLMNAIACGIETPLTQAYRAEILRLTNAQSLGEALSRARRQPRPSGSECDRL